MMDEMDEIDEMESSFTKMIILNNEEFQNYDDFSGSSETEEDFEGLHLSDLDDGPDVDNVSFHDIMDDWFDD